MIWLILSIYVLGVFASLWVMHTFKNELDINHYDPPHDDYYDDYDSNAEAYVAFSLDPALNDQLPVIVPAVEFAPVVILVA